MKQTVSWPSLMITLFVLDSKTITMVDFSITVVMFYKMFAVKPLANNKIIQ